MQLCVPVTDIFRRNQDRILPLVGAVSFKEPTDELFLGKEHMLECSLNIASPTFKEELEDAGLADALRSGRFISFACDIGPPWRDCNSNGRSPNGFPRYLPGSDPISEADYLVAAQRNVKLLRTLFPGRIKVENLNYFPTGAYEAVCEPQFIARIVRDLGIELLFDLGHTTVSIQNLGIDSDKFLAQLPLERVTEVQLSGSRWINGIFEDAHELPSDKDMELLTGIITKASVEYVTLEYYKEDVNLVTGYQKLYQNLIGPLIREKDGAGG